MNTDRQEQCSCFLLNETTGMNLIAEGGLIVTVQKGTKLTLCFDLTNEKILEGCVESFKTLAEQKELVFTDEDMELIWKYQIRVNILKQLDDPKDNLKAWLQQVSDDEMQKKQ